MLGSAALPPHGHSGRKDPFPSSRQSLKSLFIFNLRHYGRMTKAGITIFDTSARSAPGCRRAATPYTRDTLIEGFRHFVTSMTAPIASGGSDFAGWASTHWKAPPCHGAGRIAKGLAHANRSGREPYALRWASCPGFAHHYNLARANPPFGAA
jgi:hypothetical protein